MHSLAIITSKNYVGGEADVNWFYAHSLALLCVEEGAFGAQPSSAGQLGVGRRAFLDIEHVPLVGGRLCLDFVNTTGARRSGTPRERLTSYEALLVWAKRSGLLARSRVAQLRQEGRRKPERARRVLTAALALRERLYRTFLDVISDKPPEKEHLEILSAAFKQAHRWKHLVWHTGRLQWHSTRDATALGGFLDGVVGSALEVLTSDEMQRLKKCGECDWLFLDRSKNGSRRWCKKDCRDRVKARRYYRKYGQRASGRR